MLAVISALALAFAKATILFLGLYILYYRVFDYYAAKAHYSR